MRSAGALLLSVLLVAPAVAEVTVRVVPGAAGSAAQVELTARAAPLAEVLDRLSHQIGMKVVYEGAQPRQLVTLSLQGRSAAETVLSLLEGQGLNFALVADAAGTGVETLLVAGSARSTGSAAPASGASRPTFGTPFRRPLAPPPGSGPDSMDPEPEDIEEQGFDDPAEADVPFEGPEAAAADAPDDPAAVNPVPVPQGPGRVQAPAQSFPVSPFAPQVAPYTPQAFPPLPPGVPGGPTTPQPEQPQDATAPPPG